MKHRAAIRAALLISPAASIPAGSGRQTLTGATERGTPVEDLLLPLLNTTTPEQRRAMLLRHAEDFENNPLELKRILVELQLLRHEPDSFQQISSVQNRPVVVMNSIEDILYSEIPDQPNVTTRTYRDPNNKRGHYIHVEHPEEVAEQTVVLLKELGLFTGFDSAGQSERQQKVGV